MHANYVKITKYTIPQMIDSHANREPNNLQKKLSGELLKNYYRIRTLVSVFLFDNTDILFRNFSQICVRAVSASFDNVSNKISCSITFTHPFIPQKWKQKDKYTA